MQAPSIQLPKGGGAIRGIGEKFAANPVTGAGSMSVPIATSPGRSGFGPQLSLTYDSGSGNGPFGFGWNLSLPSITRKTDQGLPTYHDGVEADTFILSGVEDLVPVLRRHGNDWIPEAVPDRTIGTDTYRIKRYRPRIEGTFARIERWTNTRTNESHWRSISKDNITTVYGRTADSRIEDPDAPDGCPRVFSWLICESYGDKGNAIYYEYQPEDSAGIDRSQTNERNRTANSRSANRYLKRIKYGNKTPIAHDSDLPREFREDLSVRTDWLFEVVFDYEQGHFEVLPTGPDGRQFVNAQIDRTQDWLRRQDPFSSYRAGFEVRSYRLCRRVLMFHHFPDELGVDDYLVRATEFKYQEGPIASFITSVTQSGFKRQGNGAYLKKSLPPLEFEYSEAIIQDEVQEVDEKSLENLPQGLDGTQYQWADIDGEGLSGIVTEQADSWFYKRNVSALPVDGADGKPQVIARFTPMERLATIPSLTNLSEGRQQLLDLAGDGQLDVVEFDSPTPGFYERAKDEDWHTFRPFESLPNISWQDPNLKFVDLTGDGHADIFITEDGVFTWYPSLAEKGFASGEKVRQALDEEKGPKLLFADGTQSVYLADISGDGLTDLVRIRNSEVCYWPNLGYGRFGARVTMDNSPHFDAPDHFDQRRIRLADIDGSGVTDIIYLKDDGINIYLNEAGNRWADVKKLNSFAHIDNLSAVLVADLLGNGTACLVWSSPLPAAKGQPLRYIDLMGGQKPHLLVRTINNLGAETNVHYTPSTKFYLADKMAGKPWITKLPFPVHVIERVETYDRISRNRFVTRYAYHHGYFDGIEREFRGFGMVEQWDTEEFATLSQSREFPTGDNIEASSHVPPVLTKTWFHTGVYLGRHHISDFFAGMLGASDIGEYYREPGLTDAQARELLLEDTVLPDGLTLEEEQEACRALKGAMLRQEVYALDGTDKEPHPYTVTEQNFTLRVLQVRGGKRHTVFLTHAREAINYHYERNPADPRIAHAMTLEVDDFGNVLKEVAIGYGRRQPDIALSADDQVKQTQTLITCTENRITNAIEADDDYRTPLPCETRTYELTGIKPENNAARFSFHEWTRDNFALTASATEIPYEQMADHVSKQKRSIEQVRTLYRKDDLTAFLPLGAIDSLALPGESYKLAFTPGLLAEVFQRNGQPLMPNPALVLGGQGADQGGYVVSQDLKTAGVFPHTDPDGHWWIPSGRVFLSPISNDTAAQELAYTRQHFFLPHRYVDPFEQTSTIIYDVYDLQMVETRDALGNRVTVGERLPNSDLDPAKPGNDYRVLQPWRMMGPNRNRTQVVFDTLGMVVGTAVMGKPEDNPEQGDFLDASFMPDLSDADIDAFYNASDPHVPAEHHLKTATTRTLYDMDRFYETRQAFPQEPEKWKPVFAATLARETHVSDLETGGKTKIQISFSYSDGFGREIQQKIQAGPGRLDLSDPNSSDVNPRWVGSSWTIFNNKGKPVRQYEPFFDDTHDFTFGKQVGVSPILFYDAVERVVATLHPNHTYEKVVLDPWRQEAWDVNDALHPDYRFDPQTGVLPDPDYCPSDDLDVGHYFQRLPDSEYWPTWYNLRMDDAKRLERWPDQDKNGSPLPHNQRRRKAEKQAAEKAVRHAKTPTVVHFDSLGHPFLTVADNGTDGNGVDLFIATRTELDIEGNERAVVDAKSRIVMAYEYEMLGNRIKLHSMDAGARWMLNDVTGNPIRAWDSRGHAFRNAYDELRRPTGSFVKGADANDPNRETLFGRTVYGEAHPDSMPAAGKLNLRGQVYLQLDVAGVVFNAALNAGPGVEEGYDFKGNPLRSTRQLFGDYKALIDWTAIEPLLAVEPLDVNAIRNTLLPFLEVESFSTSTRYDALNRPKQLIAPHSNQSGTELNVIQTIYNEANLLEGVSAWLGQSLEPQNLLAPETADLNAVKDIDYDAKGQRAKIEYGNGAKTTYEYDPLTFRLEHLITRRNATAFPDDCPQPPPIGPPGCQVQNLYYTYDPAGNISHIRDDAQQTIYFKNQRVEPSTDYIYDAIYRLIEAQGREHLGQNGGGLKAPVPGSHSDAPRVGLEHPGNGNAMGNYTESYKNDEVGNVLVMRHQGTDPAQPGWKRCYQYATDSNRLLSTSGPNDRTNPDDDCSTHYADTQVFANSYEYDEHGNITRMPHLPVMEWDFEDRLHVSQRQVVDEGNGIGERTYYVYDASGQRARKVTELENGIPKDERIYLGEFEIYRKYTGNGTTIKLERETLHIMDDKRRVAIVETKTIDEDNEGSPPQLVRFQFGNHLDSASLELDDDGKVIYYEEYFPYGSTAYQAVDKSIKAAAKRYRYTGNERDEETGFYYYGARYYACWLARWVSADPAWIVDGVNVYGYVRGRPINFEDLLGMYSFSDVKSSREYTGLKPTERDSIGKIIITLNGRTNSREEYYAGKLMELLRVPDPTPQSSVNREKAQRWKTSVSSWKAQQRDKNKTEAVLDREENASNNAKFVKVISPGETKVGYYLDRHDLKNIHTKIKIKLKPFRQGERGALDKFLIESQEDEIEKFAGQTSGFTLDVDFVESDYTGDDFVEVGVNYGQWVTSENFGGNTRTLTHEIMHLLGLEDRYDYIESHATNASMTRKHRLELFNRQIERQPDPKPGTGSLMGSIGSVDETDTLLDWEVCNIAAYGDAANQSCVRQR